MPNSLKSHVLGFDTALSACSVAILDTRSGQGISETRSMARGQSEMLVPMICDAVKNAGIGFEDLGLIATTIGPGAFTGLRIGLSAARGFSLALDIPVAGITTTEAIAEKFSENNQGKDFLVVIETKRADFYFQSSLSESPEACSLSMLIERFGEQSLRICGDGLPRLKSELGSGWPSCWDSAEGYDLPDPLVIARLGVQQQKAGLLKQAVPLYLREADVSVSTRPARIIAKE